MISHSRFSSNVGDLEEELEMMIGEGIQKDIDDTNFEIKGLKQDNRNLLKKKDIGHKPDKIDFKDEIGSIQGINESPIQKQHVDERDSMVIMGSKNLENQAQKKKHKKIGGLGGTSNLRKNKLAIAFNNLE